MSSVKSNKTHNLAIKKDAATYEWHRLGHSALQETVQCSSSVQLREQERHPVLHPVRWQIYINY